MDQWQLRPDNMRHLETILVSLAVGARKRVCICWATCPSGSNAPRSPSASWTPTWNRGAEIRDFFLSPDNHWWFGTWMDYDFPFSWECHHPNWRTPSFFRGVGIPPTRSDGLWWESEICLQNPPHLGVLAMSNAADRLSILFLMTLKRPSQPAEMALPCLALTQPTAGAYVVGLLLLQLVLGGLNFLLFVGTVVGRPMMWRPQHHHGWFCKGNRSKHRWLLGLRTKTTVFK